MASQLIECAQQIVLIREPPLVFCNDLIARAVPADDKTVASVSSQLSFVDESFELLALFVEGHFVGVL